MVEQILNSLIHSDEASIERHGAHVSGWAPRRNAGLSWQAAVADSRTVRSVRNALAWSPFLEDVNVAVTVENGTVTLTGTSRHGSLRRMAAMIAHAVPGVRSVINDIRVNPSHEAPMSPSVDTSPTHGPHRQ